MPKAKHTVLIYELMSAGLKGVQSPPDEPDLNELRFIISRARIKADMTIEQLAEASGMSRQTVLNLGSGKYKGDLRTWLKVSRALGVSLDELLAPVWGDEDGDSD